jgi:uncharacterized iron-regulated membrane protein
MTTSTPERPVTARPEARTRPTGGGWFRAFWRWHFYAAFLVVPVLLVLATTGLVYLLRFQIEPLLHADLMKVDQPAGMDFTQPYDAQLAAVERAYPDATVMSMTEPSAPDRSTVFSLVLDDGSPRDVFVSPWGAEVLGDLNPDTTLSGYAVRLHADLMAGTLGDRVTELAACWAIVMALTGYVLFWKGRVARRRRRRARAAGARLRSTHALVGSVVGVGVLMLLVSGLPWTGVFGAKAQQLATAGGSSLWSTDPGAASNPISRLDESLPHSHAHEVPWGMGASEVPRSGAGEDAHGSVANVDTAVTVADREGLRHPMTVALPTAGGAGGHGSHGGGGGSDVFSVIGYAFDAPTDERTVHVDRFSGEVVSTYGFDDYPALAKVVSHGIGLHEGRSLGPWSFWGALLMCVGVVVLCLTGPLMWWRRRPSGSLGAPRGRMPLRGSPLLLVGLVVLGVLLPLFGLSVLVVLALDHLVVRRVPALAGWFGSA